QVAAAWRLEGNAVQHVFRRRLQRAPAPPRPPVRLASPGVLREMIPFTKAHAYGNDFLYVAEDHLGGRDAAQLARRLCDRHTGVGADGLMVYRRTPDGAAMRLMNADGSASEVSGNGVRGLAALLLRDDSRTAADVVIHTAAGDKSLSRTGRNGSRQTFVAAMGVPRDLRQVAAAVEGESLQLVVMDFGNPQCVVLGPLPDGMRF